MPDKINNISSEAVEKATGRGWSQWIAFLDGHGGAQRAMPLDRQALWELLTSDAGVAVWLGRARGLALEPGARYELDRGPSGEIRTIKPGHRLRLTWRAGGANPCTTLQLSLSCPRNNAARTTLRFHHEKLASEAHREQMRAHWKGVLDELVALAAAAPTCP